VKYSGWPLPPSTPCPAPCAPIR